MPQKTIFVKITAFDEPNIGVMEVDPKTGVDKELLKTILEEHFDTECEIKSVKKIGDEYTADWNADVIVDVTDNAYKMRVQLRETWVYHLNYVTTQKILKQ